MIDLRCHLLPGVDDGARDEADGIAMARVAEHDGLSAICATPHIRHDHDARIAELAARVARLQAAFDRAAVAVRVLAGGEVAETIVERLGDDELRAVSLGGAVAGSSSPSSQSAGSAPRVTSTRRAPAAISRGPSTRPTMYPASSQSLTLTRSGRPSRACWRRGGDRSTITRVPLQRVTAVGVADHEHGRVERGGGR